MPDVLLLRLDAPLMSFGGDAVDANGVTREFPATSMICGLIANALGWNHGDTDRLQSLQDRLRIAARIDRPGERLVDYQTVDLGQPHLRKEGWTTRGHPEHRAGGPAARFGTHQRWRHYHADRRCLVAVRLEPEGSPTLSEIARAIEEPARPLFLGRKGCLPAMPIMGRLVQAPNLVEALRAAPPLPGCNHRVPAYWPSGEDPETEASEPCRVISVTDRRDWHNQIHVGERLIVEGTIAMGPAEERVA